MRSIYERINGIIERISLVLEYILIHPLSDRKALLAWALIGLALVLSCVVHCLLTGSVEEIVVPYDVYFVPILASCLLFRQRGLWAIFPAIVLYHIGCVVLHPQAGLLSLLAADGGELLEWAIVAAVCLVTLQRVTQIHDHQERIQRDMEMAGTLQMALVPKDYDFGRVRIRGLMRQCQDIGGDFYYFRPFQEKYVVFCLGDVMGKGIPASMVMAIVMGFFFEWGKKSSSPSLVLSKLNKRLSDLWKNDNTWFTTLFYAVFDEEHSRLTYSSGGHQAALLLRSSGVIEQISGEGLPIGAFDEGAWEDRQVTLEDGDRVLLFTDGLTEARNSTGELFSMERVISVIRSQPITDGSELLERLEKAVISYTGGVFTDDFAVLLMEVKSGVLWNPKTSD